MGKLVYLMNVSLDGYIETADHSLDWTVVDEELHRWFTEQERSTDACLYGRRMYETMSAYWPTADADPNATEYMLEYGRVWNAKPKIVFSTTLDEVKWNSRLVRGDVAAVLESLKAEFPGDLEVSGPTLAAEFIRQGLVDEYRPVVHPAILGGGTPYLPNLERPIGLRLLESRQFSTGATYLRYAAR